MIGLWFLGDFGRLLYYIYANQAYQFILGGIMTVIMDTAVLGQFFLYKNNDLDDDIDEGKRRDSEEEEEEEEDDNHTIETEDVTFSSVNTVNV